MTADPTADTPGTATDRTPVAGATRPVVQQFLAARPAGDTGRLTGLFADEVDWQLAENPAVPWIRPRHTTAECAAQAEEPAAHTVPEEARA